MKTRLLSFIVLLLTVGSAFSQNPNMVMLREGKLLYVMELSMISCNNKMDTLRFVQSLESTKLKGRSYRDQYVTSFPDYEARKRIFRTVFSKKRATELGKYRINFTFYFDGITKKFAYIRCMLLDDHKLCLTLDELNRLEKAFRALNYDFSTAGDKSIIDWFINYDIVMRFDRLYNDNK